MLRTLLLRASTSPTLARRLPRYRFVRRSVARFMPGEMLEDALAAAERAAGSGIDAVLSRLGENVRCREDVATAVEHYEAAIVSAGETNADVQLSIKLTHLGLDIAHDLAARNLDRLATLAAHAGTVVWVDMESSAYVDRTLDVFRGARHGHTNIGICLQAYLHRTDDDLDALLADTHAIRLVKGAYAEPADVARQGRNDIDTAYHRLAVRLLDATRAEANDVAPRTPDADAAPRTADPDAAPRPVLGTHDTALLEKIGRDAEAAGVDRRAYEIQMLYGIRSADQVRLAADGFAVRVFICYGPEWFPWFVRRLAERPANLMMLAKAIMP